MPSTTSASSSGRWYAVALLLAVNLFNYLDRNILSAVVPLMQKDFFAEGDS